jgi:high-affinity nickel-transport protein
VNLALWLWALLIFAGDTMMLGTALLAWTLGLRHAVDADHIAAIDNVTRKLMQEGQRPLTVGLWFAVGHSGIVLIAAVVIALAASALSRVEQVGEIGGTIATIISATFLFAIAAMNLMILRSVLKTFNHVRSGGAYIDEDMDILLGNRGFLARIFRPLFRLVTRSWHMAPLGFLFGRGRHSGPVGGTGGKRPFDRDGPHLPAALRGGHGADRHGGRRADDGRLSMGFREADPQALL